MAVIDDSRIIAYVEADLTRGTVNPKQVVCTQYDAEMRVIAVRLKQNGKDWGIPAGYSVNVRMRKADGTSVYNPQQGEGCVAYVTLSAQMCGVEGVQKFVVEIINGSDVAQTAPIELRVIKNPIEDKDFTSEDEKETIQQAVKDAQEAAEESQQNANQAYGYAQNCITLYHQTENLKSDTQTLRDQAQTAAATAQTLAAQVEDYAEKVLGISVPAVVLSQSEYDALDPPDPKTIYIVESDGPQNSLVVNYPLTQNLSDGMDGSKVATATGCQGLGNWDGTGLSFNTAPASGAVGQHQNYITLPSNLLSGMSFSDGITLAMDLKPNATAAAGSGDWTRLINLYKHSNSPNGTAEGELYLTQGLIATAYYDGVTAQYLDASKAALITAGTWHTVAVTLGGGYLSVYLDGGLVGQHPDTTGLLSQLDNVDECYIGNSRFADNDFSGLIRNFRIYDKALSAVEIQQLGQETTWKLYYGAAQDESLDQLRKAIQDITSGTTELPYLKTSGGTMTGDVEMDGHTITGLPNPAADTAVVPKGWADGRYTPLTAAIRPTVTGNPITVTDSAEAPVQGLCVYGRTEQVTTTGVQLLPVEVGQTVTSKDDTVSASVQLDGIYIIANASATASTNSDIHFAGNPTASDESGYDSIPLSEGTYTVQNTGNFFTLFIVVWRNSSSVILANISREQTKTISIKDGDKFRIFFRSRKNGAATEKVQATITAGSTALPWEPYTGGKPSPSPEYPQELASAGDDGQIDVTVCGAQLLDPALYDANLSSNGVSFTKNEDGSVFIYGTATGTTNGYYLGEYIDVLSDGAEYVPSGGNNRAGLTVRIGYSNGDPDSYTINAFAVDKSTMSSIKPYFQVQSGVTANDTFYPMLNAGSTALPWEPYTGKTLTLTGDLPGIPVDSGGNYTDSDGQQWVCDTIDVVAKQKTQRIGIIDSYNGESVGDVWMSTTGQLTTGAKVLYQLDEPVTSQISIDKPTTYDGTTNVTAMDGAGLSLRYVADTQKYIDNKIAELQQQLAETQNALLEG